VAIPFNTIHWWSRYLFTKKPDEYSYTLLDYLDIAIGSAQGPMKWYYTMEEMKEHFKE